MTNLLGLIFDTGLAVLLILTIGYCARLSGRIRLLQDTRGELAGMIAQFDQATGRAMTSLAELQTVSRRITDGLQLKIEKANFLADDLAFLIEKSAKLASQLEAAQKLQDQLAQKARQGSIEPHPILKTAPSAVKPRPIAFSKNETPQSEIPASVKSAASLEMLLNRLAASAGVAPAQPRPNQPKPATAQPARTDAERELLEALKGR